MNRRPLGSTGIEVSEIGLGGWQLGGSGWGPTRGNNAERAIRRAVDLGINVFDTAGVYGFGRSEEILGKVLSGNRGSSVIVSKGGLAWDDRRRVRHDGRPDSLVRQVESTLRRLRRDAVDVYLLHWPDPAVPLSESAGALQEIVRSGKARTWGVANAPIPLVRALSSTSVSDANPRLGPVLQYPWNLLHAHCDEYGTAAESGREAVDAAPRERWGLFVFDVLARGLLAGRYEETTRFGKRDVRSKDRRFRLPELGLHLRRVREIARVAERLEIPLPTLIVALSLRAIRGATCLIGMRTAEQVEQCARASSVAVPDGIEDEWLGERDGGDRAHREE